MTAISPAPCRFAQSPANTLPQRRERWLAADEPNPRSMPQPPGLPAILVPVDFGDAAHTSVDYAVRMAAWAKMSVLLLHVVDRWYAGGLLNTNAKRRIKAATHARARRWLAGIADLHAANGVPMRMLVRDGVLAYEILRIAETGNVSFIVLGRARRSVLRRLLMGDVVDDVVDFSRCPVLVVPT